MPKLTFKDVQVASIETRRVMREQASEEREGLNEMVPTIIGTLMLASEDGSVSVTLLGIDVEGIDHDSLAKVTIEFE